MGIDGHSRRLLYETLLRRAFALRSFDLSLGRASCLRPTVRTFCLRRAERRIARLRGSTFGLNLPQIWLATLPARCPVHQFLICRGESMSQRCSGRTWRPHERPGSPKAGHHANERIKREGMDFLRATDHDGRVLDFHALRHTWADGTRTRNHRIDSPVL